MTAASAGSAAPAPSPAPAALPAPLVLRRPFVSALIAWLAARAVVALVRQSSPVDLDVTDDASDMIAAGLAAAAWVGVRTHAARAVRAAGGPEPPRPGCLGALALFLILGGLGAVAGVVAHARYPEAARPASIEARYADPIRRLEQIAREPEKHRPPGRQSDEEGIFAGDPAVLEATTWVRHGSASTGRLVYPYGAPYHESGHTWFPRRAETPGAGVTNLWTSGARRTVRYERAVAVRGDRTYGLTLILDLDRLEAAPP